MHAGVEVHALVVDRVAVVDLGEQRERGAEAVVCLVRVDVAHRRPALCAHEAAGQRLLAAGIVDAALRTLRRHARQAAVNPAF
jgi:hypothetical protein